MGKGAVRVFPFALLCHPFLLTAQHSGKSKSDQEISAPLSKKAAESMKKLSLCCTFLQPELALSFAEFANVIYKRNGTAWCSLKARHINTFNLMASYEFQVWDAGRNLKANTFFFFFF